MLDLQRDLWPICLHRKYEVHDNIFFYQSLGFCDHQVGKSLFLILSLLPQANIYVLALVCDV